MIKFRSLLAVSVATLSGCACFTTGPLTQKAAFQANRQASVTSGTKGLEALMCAQRYAERNWQAGTATEVGDASLAACANEIETFAEATVKINEVKAAVLATDESSKAIGQYTSARRASEEIDRKRAEVRGVAVRRTLELQRASRPQGESVGN